METPMFSPSFADTGITTIGSYYPLKLTWDNQETGRKWSLEVKSHPEQKITFEGDEPTKGEMAELLLKCGDMRHCLLEIFMVLATVARGKEA